VKPKAGVFQLLIHSHYWYPLQSKWMKFVVLNALQMHKIEVPCQPVFFSGNKDIEGGNVDGVGWGGGKGNVGRGM
jgi:hypothetical protein